jgi:hypothetical protein
MISSWLYFRAFARVSMNVLKDRLNTLKADRDRSKAALERAKSHSSQASRIDPALLEQFGRSMRENITLGGDSVPQGLSAVPHLGHRGRRYPNPDQGQQRRVRKSRLGQPEGGQSGFAHEWRTRPGQDHSQAFANLVGSPMACCFPPGAARSHGKSHC